MKQLGWWLRDSWQPAVTGALLIVISSLIIGFRLGTLPGGLSQAEIDFVRTADSGRDIFDDPLFLPQKLFLYIFIKLGQSDAWVVRTPSALFTLIAVVSLFWILKSWFTKRIAILGTLLFLTSSWLLSAGRLALPDVNYLLFLPLLGLSLYLYKAYRRRFAFVLLTVACGLAVYIPSFIWFVIILAVWRHQTLYEEIKRISVWWRLTCFLVLALLWIPLVLAIIRNPELGLSVLGGPNELSAFNNFSSRLIDIPKQLAVIGPTNPLKNLGRLPLLDAWSLVMALLGFYSLRYSWRLTRARLLIGGLLSISVLLASGGLVTMSILIPLIYILSAYGIAFMLQSWFTVFPRNPIARTTGTLVVSIAVVLASFYHLNRYFIAWAQAPETRQQFRHSLVK